ncbi:MAG: hypothetical protein BGN96_13145 [Bacteroidales bacterium 45-6]|nr:MAG: hypothetical protein BGN96_13145 [Bacteroidales bacterium 45-6]
MKTFTRLFKQGIAFTLLFFLSSAVLFNANAQSNIPLRRPISPSSPMWLIHIDTWNYPDPQKIIDLIPADIRPYVVMNISLSISHDVPTSRFKVAEYGYETAKSWLRTCAENRIWATVQVASGGMHQLSFSETDLSTYEEFFRDYPNFLGFNFAEQFWGFDDPSDPVSAKWADRISHFVDLLKLSNKYGAYLVVSWCGNEYGQSINPIGMLKRNPAFAAACQQYTSNYILCDKYTTTGYYHDMESVCLGAYLSGFSGQYGIRYDNSGWTDATGVNQDFTLSSGVSTHLEHLMLNGATVIDGPEIIWLNCFKELNATYTPDGFKRRNWGTYQHFDNVQIDLFRKMLDGTIRIPSRKEVIDRAKYVVVNDISSGKDNDVYCSPQTLFDGLYMMDGESNYQYNHSFFKKSGRYPTIPTVYKLNPQDADANSFQFKINKSAYPWNTVAAKTTEMNQYFPEQSTGDLYVGRNQNALVTYNPYKTLRSAKGCIPLKYNTCDSVVLKYPRYSGGVVKEYSDKITFYLSNFEDEYNSTDHQTILTNNVPKNDTIKIYGSVAEPTYSFTVRGTHAVAPVLSKNWSNGVLSLFVSHNGPLDIQVNCSGSATNRLTTFTAATMNAPTQPAIYTGSRQYEAECSDYMNINGLVASGYSEPVRNYTGQGYLKFGISSNSAFRDSANVYKKGTYGLKIRYSSPSNISTIDLYVNGTKVSTPVFANTNGNWQIYTQNVSLNQGKNEIKLMANNSTSDIVLFDNFVVSPASESTKYDFSNDVATSSASNPAAQFVTVRSGSAGVVSYTDANNKTDNSFKTYSVGTINGTGVADLDLFPSNSVNYSVAWKEYSTAAGAKKGVLLRATGSNGSCGYADGMKQGYLFIVLNNDDNTVTLKPYVAGTSGLTAKPTYTSSFTVPSGQPCWYRATAVNDKLIFECSKDSITWEGAATTTFSDNSYVQGASELVWGLNSNNYSWVMDNIAYSSAVVSLSQLSLPAFKSAIGQGPSANQSFVLSGQSLIDNIQLQAPANFEISLSAGSGYAASLTVPAVAGAVVPTTVYARLKSGLSINTYSGNISITSTGTSPSTVSLNGSVNPLVTSRSYNFTNDMATTYATTPPALNVAIGQSNGATAGVVSYTDATSTTSNMLKPYSGGKRNITGVIDLSLFSSKSTDYSVTWKQCLGSAGADRKFGVLLRGDATKIGDDATGYVQGMMQGYVFIVYSKSGGGSEFRIYRSTATFNALDMKVNAGVSTLTPTAGQPMWYRASVSGNAPVNLKFEYSTDSITWTTASTYSESVASFTSGATQLIWGLGAGDVNFYVDNISFNGIEDPAGGMAAIDQVVVNDLTVVSTEYYTIAGAKVSNSLHNLKGLYIVRKLMSDGSIRSSKIFVQ